MKSKYVPPQGALLGFAISTALYLALYLLPGRTFSAVPVSIVQLVRVVALFSSIFFICEKFWPMKIYNKIFLGMVFGILAGIVFQESMVEVKPIGTVFIRLISMVIIPLVFASLLIGTASMDPKKMGRIGLKTMIYYLIYTAFAIAIGLVLANTLKPGSGIPAQVQAELLSKFSEDGARVSTLAQQTNPIDILVNIIPTNLFESLSGGTILQIIFFAIFAGVALALIPKEKVGVVLSFFDGINETMIKIVQIAIRLAPYGVCALMASVIGTFGTDILLTLVKYTAITISGMIILNFTYPLIVKLFSGMKFLTFMRGIRSPQLIAFSTSSSSATLPVTIEACTTKLGVPQYIAGFVLPLGATVNMNGTALYHGVSAVFIAQVFGIPLDLGDQLMIVLTATLAAIGCAGAPMVGILMLVVVLKQVGIPTEGIALIFGVERILDMFRTAINITGDASAAVVIAASEGELNIDFAAAKTE